MKKSLSSPFQEGLCEWNNLRLVLTALIEEKSGMWDKVLINLKKTQPLRSFLSKRKNVIHSDMINIKDITIRIVYCKHITISIVFKDQVDNMKITLNI